MGSTMFIIILVVIIILDQWESIERSRSYARIAQA